jgi:mannitol/fructose-specific phosphotransferase system IIA component (Ntr-type)
MYNTIRLSEQLSENRVIIRSLASKAEDIVREMIQLLADELGPEVCEEVYEKVFEREKLKTTGIGHGVAIPHARTIGAKQLYCAAATSENGIEFNAMDRKLVNLFFLIVSPNFTVGPHLNIISAVSHLISKNANINADTAKAQTPAEFMKILKEKEEKYIT